MKVQNKILIKLDTCNSDCRLLSEPVFHAKSRRRALTPSATCERAAPCINYVTSMTVLTLALCGLGVAWLPW